MFLCIRTTIEEAPQVFAPPTPLEVALEDLESLLSSPSLRLLGEHTRNPFGRA